MKGGIGSASHRLPNGIVVAALVAVNARGDVIDPATGQVVAGVRTLDGRQLADARQLLRQGIPAPPAPAENTTLGIVATNATLTKTEASLVARMAHDGFARAIAPVHTPSDGDTVFALATGKRPGAVDVGLIGALAADVTAQAIVNAVRHAEALPALPSARSLARNR
jgi:L-aminopeptidase/D-esterase-like protein